MRKLLILVLDDLLGSFRSKKAILFLVLYLGIFFAFYYGFIRLEGKIVGELENRGFHEPTRRAASAAVTGVLREKDDTKIVDFLLAAPYFNTAIFVLSIFCTPGLILLLRYDVPVREIGDGTLRFLTFRVSRSGFLLARFLGGVLEFALITLAAHAAAIVWVKIQVPLFPAGVSWRAGFFFWLRLQFFFSVFIALAILVSVTARRPILSLLLSVLAVLALFFLPLWTDYLSPFDIKYISGLFSGPGFPFYRTLGAYLGFAALFFGVGVLIFRRKNL